MAREGTRSQTGHSKPRIFETVDTAPVTQRKKTTTKPAVKKAPVAPAVKGAKPTGVTKKKTAPKKDGPVAKVRPFVLVILVPCPSNNQKGTWMESSA
ncbi:uncharacterized protein VDAG_05397 [Verticillium dahliae VdLs.17]|uniref:Uncharacterized protein n=1 Tax=Verticillium dahliae (strain VdLs.17 / ATCC MYA-4575 / FGSC 10137) TaxID=498257 RepID=G2X592_VERDV|nr:uncharacterized protein VDAG_05397 [Verticillium dahliae VdLs.17]EGY14233.1 hypothetical protein VDAG_05397 [Verticillium dahliae VdLs.17]